MRCFFICFLLFTTPFKGKANEPNKAFSVRIRNFLTEIKSPHCEDLDSSFIKKTCGTRELNENKPKLSLNFYFVTNLNASIKKKYSKKDLERLPINKSKNSPYIRFRSGTLSVPPGQYHLTKRASRRIESLSYLDNTGQLKNQDREAVFFAFDCSELVSEGYENIEWKITEYGSFPLSLAREIEFLKKKQKLDTTNTIVYNTDATNLSAIRYPHWKLRIYASHANTSKKKPLTTPWVFEFKHAEKQRQSSSLVRN